MDTVVLPKVDHTPAELSDDAKGLLKAADIIEREGFYNGTRGSGGQCTLSAIHKACGDGYNPLGVRLSNVFCKAMGFTVVSEIPVWNDKRTKDEAVAKLRSVALSI